MRRKVLKLISRNRTNSWKPIRRLLFFSRKMTKYGIQLRQWRSPERDFCTSRRSVAEFSRMNGIFSTSNHVQVRSICIVCCWYFARSNGCCRRKPISSRMEFGKQIGSGKSGAQTSPPRDHHLTVVWVTKWESDTCQFGETSSDAFCRKVGRIGYSRAKCITFVRIFFVPIFGSTERQDKEVLACWFVGRDFLVRKGTNPNISNVNASRLARLVQFDYQASQCWVVDKSRVETIQFGWGRGNS